MSHRDRYQEMMHKRRQRARQQAAAGQGLTSENIRHPKDCLCYDCLWGAASEYRPRVVRVRRA